MIEDDIIDGANSIADTIDAVEDIPDPLDELAARAAAETSAPFAPEGLEAAFEALRAAPWWGRSRRNDTSTITASSTPISAGQGEDRGGGG